MKEEYYFKHPVSTMKKAAIFCIKFLAILIFFSRNKSDCVLKILMVHNFYNQFFSVYFCLTFSWNLDFMFINL